jgi:urea-proton symporter
VDHRHHGKLPSLASLQPPHLSSFSNPTPSPLQTIILLVVWPFPLYGSGYVFSKSFFTGWVTVGIIWIFCSLGAVGLFPIFEGRHTLVRTIKAMVSGKRPAPAIHAQEVAEGKSTGGTPGNATPPEKAVKEDIVSH